MKKCELFRQQMRKFQECIIYQSIRKTAEIINQFKVRLAGFETNYLEVSKPKITPMHQYQQLKKCQSTVNITSNTFFSEGEKVLTILKFVGFVLKKNY